MKNFIIILFIYFSVISYSQNNNIGVEFKYKTETIDNITAIFSIYGINTEEKANKLKKTLLNDENIISFKIFYNKRCKIEYKNNIDANYIRKIFRTDYIDYDMDYVTILDKFTEEELFLIVKANYDEYKIRHTSQRGDWIIPNDYPTEETVKDKETRLKLQTQWIENNLEKYKK